MTNFRIWQCSYNTQESTDRAIKLRQHRKLNGAADFLSYLNKLDAVKCYIV